MGLANFDDTSSLISFSNPDVGDCRKYYFNEVSHFNLINHPDIRDQRNMICNVFLALISLIPDIGGPSKIYTFMPRKTFCASECSVEILLYLAEIF